MLVLVGNAGPAPIRVLSLHSLHIVTFGYTICCLSPCCHYSISKSIEFVNFVNCFRCLEINSCLFFGQLPCFDISLFSVSVGFCIMCVCVCVCVWFKLVTWHLYWTYPVTRRLKVTASLGKCWLHPDTEGSVQALVRWITVQRHQGCHYEREAKYK